MEGKLGSSYLSFFPERLLYSSHKTLTTLHFWCFWSSKMCVKVSLHTRWVSYNLPSLILLTWRVSGLQVRAQPHRKPIPTTHTHTCTHSHYLDANFKAKLSFWPTGCRSEVPTTASLNVINLQEWLRVLREIPMFTSSWKNMDKDLDKHPDGRGAQGRCRAGPGSHIFWGTTLPAFPHVHPPQTLSKPVLMGLYGGFVM